MSVVFIASEASFKAASTCSATWRFIVVPSLAPCVGQTQVDQRVALEGLLDAVAPSWAPGADEKAKIVTRREAYHAALKQRETAMVASAALRAKRDMAKEDFLDVYAARALESSDPSAFSQRGELHLHALPFCDLLRHGARDAVGVVAALPGGIRWKRFGAVGGTGWPGVSWPWGSR